MDEGDKVRRNLVVASTGIILYYWLELPPGAIAKRLLVLEQEDAIEPWRIWIALLCVLVYLGYRFFHVAKKAEQVILARKELISTRISVVIAFARIELERAKKRGSLKGTIFRTLYSHLQGSSDPQESHPAQNGDLFDWSAFTIAEIKMTGPDSAPWQGTAAVLILIGETPGSSRQLFYRISRIRRLLIDLQAARTLLGQEVVPEHLLPFVLGTAALVLSMTGLVGSVIH